MFEFAILGIVAYAVYALTKEGDAPPPVQQPPSTKPTADETADFAEHLAALTSDDEVITELMRFEGMTESGDAAKRQVAESSSKDALAAWHSPDPQRSAEVAFEMRLVGKRLNISSAAHAHFDALTAMYRDRVEKLSSQGEVMDLMFNRLDSAPAAAKLTPALAQSSAVIAADADLRSIDLAAIAPWYGIFDEGALHTADVETDGVAAPVYKGILLYPANTPDSVMMDSAAVKLLRFVRKTTSDSGIDAHVFVAEVTSDKPAGALGARIFVFAPPGVTFGMPSAGMI